MKRDTFCDFEIAAIKLNNSKDANFKKAHHAYN